MKNINRNTIIIALATLVVGLILGWLLFGGKSSPNHDHKITETKQRVWTCSMHPSVRQNEPGKCPICGMDLIPLEADHGEENPLEIKMSAVAIKLANIQTSIVGAENPVKEILLNGKVQTDEKNVYTQTSHIAGRIEDLKLSITGEYVRKGREIALVYSPELVTAQKELFEAYKIRESQPELYSAAREKLMNWKLTEKQIDGILEKGMLKENFPIISDASGVVTKKSVNLGDYVKQGSALYEIANLSNLWILFDVYESALPWVKVGDELEYSVQSLPGETFTGKIDFIDPVINPKTRVAKARISVSNKDAKLKPEMFASAVIKSSIQKDEQSQVVPKSAVMWTGKRSVVYVKSETDAGVAFEMREVTLGPSLGDSYLIESGLQSGEEIATNGTFSIDAAAQLAGKPSMMSPEGGSLMSGHQHGGISGDAGMHIQRVNLANAISVSSEARQALSKLIDSYLHLKDALVNDDYESSMRYAKQVSKDVDGISMNLFTGDAYQIWMEEGAPLLDLIKQVANAEDIEKARKPFKPFSAHLINLALAFQPVDKPLYVQHCPMADDFKGADWLSTEDNVMNPYYGASMLTCGEVKDTIKPAALTSSQNTGGVKSPHTTAMTNIGDNHVHIDYSSPRVRGRQIFGGLVAYDQVWSIGAHNATSITFSQDVNIENTSIKAGKYALFTIPGREEWTVIINKNWDQHLADDYDQAEDVLRFNIVPKKEKNSKEELTFKVIPKNEKKGVLSFQWADVSFEFEIENQ